MLDWLCWKCTKIRHFHERVFAVWWPCSSVFVSVFSFGCVSVVEKKLGQNDGIRP